MCLDTATFQINKSKNQLPLSNGNAIIQTIKSHEEAQHPETNCRNVRSRKVDGASNN
jgi:hypothetical protein